MAKTDRLDAKLLAEYGLERSPKSTPLPDPLLVSIESRMKRRQQLVRERAREKNRRLRLRVIWFRPKNARRENDYERAGRYAAQFTARFMFHTSSLDSFVMLRQHVRLSAQLLHILCKLLERALSRDLGCRRRFGGGRFRQPKPLNISHRAFILLGQRLKQVVEIGGLKRFRIQHVQLVRRLLPSNDYQSRRQEDNRRADEDVPRLFHCSSVD